MAQPGDQEPAPSDDAPAPPAPPAAVVVPAPAAVIHDLEPVIMLAGGLRLESLKQAPGETAEARHPTVAISRFGLRGKIGEHVTFASVIEASLGGALGYGASVWEGQAELAVRDQWVRYARGGASIAVGRVVDDATFDFVSVHAGDLFYTDQYTRDPLLYAGADFGTGIRGTLALGPHLTLGLTFHSTNPTGLTGTVIIGGKLAPFDRPFDLAAAQVGRSQQSLPDQNLHIYFGTPSLVYSDDLLDVKLAAEAYYLDTQMAIRTDDPIRGYNLRGDVRLKLDGGRLRPFVNASRNENEILSPTDATMRLAETFRSYELSGGADYDYAGRNGVGVQYALVDSSEPGQHTREHYASVATSYWVEPELAFGVRASVYVRQVSGDPDATGSRSLFFTMRLVL
jgi:hypothetical protein